VAGLTRFRRVVHDERAAALFETRREGAVVECESHGAFRARIEGAEQTAVEIVRRARAGEHERRPLEKGTCTRCDWRAVCRPDVAALERGAEA
jgi:radical SAM protein with 4Fe4S-binding SPASM domain